MNEQQFPSEKDDVTPSPSSSPFPSPDNAPIHSYIPIPLNILLTISIIILGIMNIIGLEIITVPFNLVMINSELCPNCYCYQSGLCVSKETHLITLFGIYLPMISGSFFAFLPTLLDKKIYGVTLALALLLSNMIGILIFFHLLLEVPVEPFLNIHRDHNFIINFKGYWSINLFIDIRLLTFLWIYQSSTIVTYIMDQLTIGSVTPSGLRGCGLLLSAYILGRFANPIDLYGLLYFIGNYIKELQSSTADDNCIR